MITIQGKELIAKFLLSQAPAYASYIAAGVGSSAASFEDEINIPVDKKTLDFEAFRVPIISKGFIKENGQEKILFKAEMPSEQRYEITEIGIFPAINNAVAGKYDSRLLVAFTPSEQWSYFLDGSGSAVPYLNDAIDSDNTLSNVNEIIESVLFINSDSTIFNNQARIDRKEPPRFLNRSLMVSGSASYLDSSFVPSSDSISIENSNISLDLGKNLPGDQIKIALSVISKESSKGIAPEKVRILLEFINNIPGIDTAAPKATLKIDLSGSDFEDNFGSTRYLVVSRTLSQFVRDDDFSWANVNYIKLYSSVIEDEEETDEYYVIFDGIRLENVTSENPLYSMVSYNIIQTEDARPILKQENTTNYIEYRFAVGVDG